MNVSRPHLPALDSLRGLAALAVCLMHATPLFGLSALAPHAYVAVDFFFVLSGFVLYYRYAHVLLPGAGRSMGAGAFMLRRVARLYPLYVLATLMGFALTTLWLAANGNLGAEMGASAYALISGLLMIPAVLDTSGLHDAQVLFPYVDLGWSIFWEIVMSVVFVFWAKAGLRFLSVVGAVAFLALAAAAWSMGSVDGGWQLANFHVGGLRALTGFCLGMMVARGFLARRVEGSPARARPLLALAALALVAVAGAYVALDRQFTVLGVELLLLAAVFPAVVWLTAVSAPRILSRGPGVVLGGASYSIYLLHGSLLEATSVVVKRIPFLTPSPLVGLAWLVGVLAVSWLCWKVFETPARGWVMARFESPKRPALAEG